MNLAEVLAAVVTAFLASAAITAYLLDAAGVGLSPLIVLAVSVAVAIAVAVFWFFIRHARVGATDLVAWASIVGSVFTWLLSITWPGLLPPGRGPDLAHHLLLVDYIERAGHLVHDRALEGAMGEMAHYTPGAHVLAVLLGAWTGTDGLGAFYPLLAACAALTAGFVYLIARRLAVQIPFAIAGVLLLLLPRDYFVGAFTHDSFLAQGVSAFFCVAAWWALTVWQQQKTASTAGLFGLFVTAVFLSWPVWIGPPLLVFLGVLLRRHITVRWRVKHFLIAMAPLAIVGLIHATGRFGWVLLVRTSGAVLQPSVAVVGWAFPALAAIGIACVVLNPRIRLTVGLVFAIGLQAIILLFMSRAIGAETPYMAYKMIYLAIYPLAVIAAAGLHTISRRVTGPAEVLVGWVIMAILMVTAARPALAIADPIPVVSRDLDQAGRWTRANVGASCADYLVANAETAYWLHLAVLGNARSSAHTAEVDGYDPRAAMGRWVASQGRSHAVVDLRLLPNEVSRKVEFVARFGTAAVIRRPGATCPDP